MKWKRKRDPVERLADMLTEDENGCWVHRSPDANGYGRLGVGGASVYAHRYMYERMVEDIPDGLVIDHLCRNRACANPEHLDVVPQRINCRRGDRAGVRVAECKHGHEYTPENTYTNPQGHRSCRTCKREKAAA